MYTIKHIQLQKNSPEQASYAADELRYYLSLMCGVSIPVQNEQMENSVILEQVACPELGEDGFKLIPEDTSIRICGGKRGIIYGAYELLEMLGCRFFTPECEKVPTVAKLELELDSEIQQVPIFEYREHDYRDLTHSPRFAVKRRMNGDDHPIPEKLGGHLSYVWYVHTFDKLVPPSIYGESHPEYYAVMPDGNRSTTPQRNQLCLTNPDVVEIAVDSVRKALNANPKGRKIGRAHV